MFIHDQLISGSRQKEVEEQSVLHTAHGKRIAGEKRSGRRRWKGPSPWMHTESRVEARIELLELDFVVAVVAII
jgi:hypothetical protein